MRYQKVLNIQNRIANEFNRENEKNFKNILILTEHNPVYTIGIRTERYPASEQIRLEKMGAEFYKTNRGGLITFHGPGQLVAYPIFNLRSFVPSVRWYVGCIENTIIDLCCKYTIKAETSPDTGVWVGNSKICAIGIHCKEMVTSHGLALNCNTDLTWFSHVVPCGLVGRSVTSISQQLNKKVTIDEVTPDFLESFSKKFDCNLVELSPEETFKYLKNS